LIGAGANSWRNKFFKFVWSNHASEQNPFAKGLALNKIQSLNLRILFISGILLGGKKMFLF